MRRKLLPPTPPARTEVLRRAGIAGRLAEGLSKVSDALGILCTNRFLLCHSDA